uniref:Uncharacterized protein n=1 Tax=Ralstonia solanacearum CFBP2957 TaxID=859656 RepID=D8P5X4_RALSL|nr:protein of unknown function [Ralstonia solanacearum CFBP2957]
MYFLKPGSAWLIVSLHAYKAFAARNRAEGWQIALRAAWGLGGHFECAQAPQKRGVRSTIRIGPEPEPGGGQPIAMQGNVGVQRVADPQHRIIDLSYPHQFSQAGDSLS